MVKFENIQVSLGKVLFAISVLSGGIYWQAYEISEVKTEVRHLVKRDAEEKRSIEVLVADVLRNKLGLHNLKVLFEKEITKHAE